MHNGIKKLFFGLILLFMILPLSSAISPVLSTIQAGSLEIIAPSFLYITESADLHVSWHVFNVTQLLTNETVTCGYHLFSEQANGGDIYVDNDVGEFTEDRDFEVELNGSNFSELGDYCHLIECRTSTQTGALERCFVVTPNGEAVTEGQAIFYVGLLMILSLFLVFCVFGFVSFENLLSKIGLFGLGYLLSVAISFIGWQMSNDFLTSTPFLLSFLKIIFIVLMIGIFPLVIGGFAYYVYMLFEIKEIEQLMEKGMSYDEAKKRRGKKFK